MDNPIDKVAEELAKKLPVKQIYNEALSGAVTQVGHSLTDVAKAIRLVLLPVEIAGAYHERISRFLDRAVRGVPEDQRTAPAPQILGPVLEGIRYEPEGTDIEEMFSELLSRAIDRDRVAEAHPSYPGIIRQLSQDEARILAALRGGDRFCHYRLSWPTDTGVVDKRIIDSDDLLEVDLTFRDNIDFYFQHFDILGLASMHKEILGELGADEVDGKAIRRGSRHRRVYQLTPFGQRFVQACVKS